MKAFDDSSPAEYDAVIASGQKGYAPMAALIKAKLERTQDKPAEAIKALDGIINSSYDRAFREKAMIDKAFILMGEKDAKGSDILGLLEKASAPDAAFRSTALELKASYFLQTGDKKKALDIFTSLSRDENIPATQQERAKHIVAAME
jgi:hypothetical protein